MTRDSSTRAKIREEIFNLESWTYDWNRAGGLPIRPDVFTLLQWIVPVLCVADDRLLHRLGVPVIELNQDGTVDWYWEYCGRSLCLTFLCEGTVKYLRTFEDDATSVSGTVVQECLSTLDYQISSLIHWLCTGLLKSPEVYTR